MRTLLPLFAMSAMTAVPLAQTPLWTIEGDTTQSIGFGNAVAGGLDWDGDGIPDVAVGSETHSGSKGRVQVFAGLTGEERFEAFGDFASFPGPSSQLGTSLAFVGDLDGDGRSELAAGALFDSGAADDGGLLRVWRSDGSLWFDFPGTVPGALLGLNVAGVGDLDGDHVSEVAVGSALGTAYVVSGASGAQHVEYLLSGSAGHSVAGAGDLDLDGVPDLLIGAKQVNIFGGALGYAQVRSGTELTLTRDLPAVSLSAGGAQELTLAAGPAQAGKLYLVLGSLTGNSPGLPVQGVVLPLVFDVYTTYTLLNPNAIHLPGSFGTLDGAGSASATYQLPAGSPPGWVGLTSWHAFVTFSSQVDFASNATTVALIP